MGYHVVDMLKDNPQLVEWLFGYKELEETIEKKED